MLSNPTNNLHNRQKQHRRQNSTPTAFESVKVNNLPNIQRHAHRRGMSLDQRRQQAIPQEISVSTTNNQGYQTAQQHILRETQQQRLARPGQQFTSFDNDENYLNSPIVTPNRQTFDAGSQYGERAPSLYSYSGPINTAINVDPNSYGGNDFNLFSSDALTPSAYLDFSAGFDGLQNSDSSSRRSSSGRRISGGIVDRVVQYENLALKSPQRPITPPNQNGPSYFPLTPADTPYHRTIKHEQIPQRFMGNYDTSMEETIKPRSNQRAKGIFDDMRKDAETNRIPSPPGSGHIPSESTFDSAPMPSGNFMNMSNLNMSFMKSTEIDGSQYSPVSSNVSPTLSYHSSPEMEPMQLFGDPFTNTPNLEPGMSYPEPSAHGLAIDHSPISGSPYRRSESVSSTILEDSITDTGVTIDDIATFISGPDTIDGKWLCLYPECKKRFGRKENIKSHVQTHLGDRQFQCPHCRKCFVRQHDLKRHAKIHSGVKPYPCQCGNSFARHDALTRHRQRGMCIGAFEGVVKKTVKRGRPRKNRPDNEERIKKSSRTRSKNKTMSSASSTTGSDSNCAYSPQSEFDDILDDKPFAHYENTQALNASDNASFDQCAQLHSPNTTDCVSPQAIHAQSPSAYSSHSTSRGHRGSLTDHFPSHPASPAKSVHSYHSPPGLCESSSSPAASIHYYDVDPPSNHDDALKLTSLANIAEHDDEMFLEAFRNNEMTQLERDPDLLLGKFDDTFAVNESDEMFHGGEDVFFGSP
ncbi:Metallothionein expression activator [Hyphodiscus hymeniophilus]|uniref:Metallothionein expression activator n=1 Tax=Hyphodiscus hymeniophilus TaxID=353542 RepID=A0A9P7AVB6_9HELO|nr:Metallothionein expression activator [Hyphodiscus hymeniophilus]